MREKFIYIGDGIRAPDTDELVGLPYQDLKTGRTGKVVANTGLTITIEFQEPSIISRIFDWFKGWGHEKT